MTKLLEFAEQHLRQSVREAMGGNVEGDVTSRVVTIRNIRKARETATSCGMTIDDADAIILDEVRKFYQVNPPPPKAA